MSETSNEEAKTIHRLLEMGYSTDDDLVFFKNEEEPIKADVIIVDEASMIDILLMFSLVNAIKPGTRFIDLVFFKNEEEPIKADVIIVDEASMIDILLMFSLVNAIKPGTRFIIVGDSDQLPSVGAGNVLRDIIDSQVIKVVRLDEIFRQAQRFSSYQSCKT